MEDNQRLLSHLRASLSVDHSNPDQCISTIDLLKPYLRLISRPYRNARWNSEFIGTGRGPGEVVFYGVPLGIAWNKEPIFAREYWYDSEGSLLQARVTTWSDNGPWDEYLRVATDGPINWNDPLARSTMPSIASKCREYLCRLAEHRLNLSVFSSREQSLMLKEFYFQRRTDGVFHIYWNAFVHVIENYHSNHKTDEELLTLATQEIELGHMAMIPLTILVEMGSKKAALRLLAISLKQKKAESHDPIWTIVRSTMHSLGAKQQLGWCPCDECSPTYQAWVGRLPKDRFKGRATSGG
ncbi:MAG: hypothetical protein ABR913_06815 [Sedimentisphaerales bacterium]|jgi:hypothetical protein